MAFPGENEFRIERKAVLATMEGLTDKEFESAPTLCDGWAPRDVGAHLMGIDNELMAYVRAYGNLHKAHADIIARARQLDRAAFMVRFRTWAASPALVARTASWGLLGDLCIHHQDILRGLDRNRATPIAVRDAILREGTFLGAKKLLSYRVEPNDGGRAIGRRNGPDHTVRGTSEAIGMWLTGRKGLESELTFS